MKSKLTVLDYYNMYILRCDIIDETHEARKMNTRIDKLLDYARDIYFFPAIIIMPNDILDFLDLDIF